MGSCCLPWLKGPSQLTFPSLPGHSRTDWQIHSLLEIGSGPGLGWAGNAHCRPRAAQIQKPCLACCTAPASTTPARVMQLSLSRCRLVGGAQSRDCNLHQTGQNRAFRVSVCSDSQWPSNKECFREAELLQCSCHTPKQAVCTAVVHPRADWQMQAPSRSDLGEIPARRWGQSTQEGQSLPCSLLAAEVLHGPCAR
jgi:hypothetical protein